MSRYHILCTISRAKKYFCWRTTIKYYSVGSQPTNLLGKWSQTLILVMIDTIHNVMNLQKARNPYTGKMLRGKINLYPNIWGCLIKPAIQFALSAHVIMKFSSFIIPPHLLFFVIVPCKILSVYSLQLWCIQKLYVVIADAECCKPMLLISDALVPFFILPFLIAI